MKMVLQKLFQEVVREMGVSDIAVEVTMSGDPIHGEYTTNIAMRLAKQLKKSPMEIALQVSENVKNKKARVESKSLDQNTIKKDQRNADNKRSKNILQDIDRIEVAPPGFINVFINEASLSAHLGIVLKEGERFGTGKTEDRRVTVEFTDPNPFKEFHIGHLYSNAVGEAVSRLLESQGNTVRRVCYQGDVGMHVAKTMYGLLNINDVVQQMKALEDDTLTKKAQFLGKAYVKGAKAFEENEEAREAMKTLNKLAFIAAQGMWEREKGMKPIVNYASTEAIDPKKLQEVSFLYETGRRWSLGYFDTIYARLGTTFSGYYFESAVGERGVSLVRSHIKDGIFEESEGAVVYRGEKKGLHTRVFINQLGLPTYEAKELGLAPTKYDDWGYDFSIIVTGNEINEYFKVLLAALSEIAPELAAKTRHMGHGMVRNADGSKMSSRSGQILTGEGLLDEVKESIYNIIDTSNQKYSKEDRELIAEKAAIAAVKYSLLRVSLPSDVAFDVKTSVSFDGDSGPYLLYTYARCKSVLGKATNVVVSPKAGSAMTLNPEEKAIARLIYFFPEIVGAAAQDLAPNVLCTYLFELAASFNVFYAKHQILTDVANVVEFRLVLTSAVAQVLKNGLYLLGIPVVERM